MDDSHDTGAAGGTGPWEACWAVVRLSFFDKACRCPKCCAAAAAWRRQKHGQEWAMSDVDGSRRRTGMSPAAQTVASEGAIALETAAAAGQAASPSAGRPDSCMACCILNAAYHGDGDEVAPVTGPRDWHACQVSRSRRPKSGLACPWVRSVCAGCRHQNSQGLDVDAKKRAENCGNREGTTFSHCALIDPLCG
ncbi:hypothetical protein BU23DRAFT_635160 [Bimuria novae-zelandiae CBS 107.79]|uniref:Uncharacterized protein n=1 Tax=Bimuria novae-zelandiae CBS 107.79 TaxID=1447943 RepID=A0A6A5VD43_9PLEO|nr:hypothetical protein BU23DRAFT_635160 [Bimuria novae-zelandiae CBS 107.79]